MEKKVFRYSRLALLPAQNFVSLAQSPGCSSPLCSSAIFINPRRKYFSLLFKPSVSSENTQTGAVGSHFVAPGEQLWVSDFAQGHFTCVFSFTHPAHMNHHPAGPGDETLGTKLSSPTFRLQLPPELYNV